MLPKCLFKMQEYPPNSYKILQDKDYHTLIEMVYKDIKYALNIAFYEKYHYVDVAYLRLASATF